MCVSEKEEGMKERKMCFVKFTFSMPRGIPLKTKSVKPIVVVVDRRKSDEMYKWRNEAERQV